MAIKSRNSIKRTNTKRTVLIVVAIILVVGAVVASRLLPLESLHANLLGSSGADTSPVASPLRADPAFSLSDVPDYAGNPSVEINGNEPYFTAEELAREAFEEYSPLDRRGRCGPAFALIGPETLATERRGSIGMIRPSGWQTARYEWIDGIYLFNRCHLIGYQLSGQNDNELNLITGTRSMNILGMQPYENETAYYIRRTHNHVLYRVTPVFEGSNLVASGVLMEAQSIEDDGAGLRYCVWCYNVEPGVSIDYATGKNKADGTIAAPSESDASVRALTPVRPEVTAGETNASNTEETAASAAASADGTASAAAATNSTPTTRNITDSLVTYSYVLNTNTHRFHRPDCASVQDMKDKNRSYFDGTREEAIEAGYKPCGVCNP